MNWLAFAIGIMIYAIGFLLGHWRGLKDGRDEGERIGFLKGLEMMTEMNSRARRLIRWTQDDSDNGDYAPPSANDRVG